MSEPTAGEDPPVCGGTAGSLPLTTQAGKSAAAAAALAARASAEKDAAVESEAVGIQDDEALRSSGEVPASTVSEAEPPRKPQPAATAVAAVQPQENLDKAAKPPAPADPPVANPTPGAIKRKALSGLMARLAKPKARRRSNGAAPAATAASAAAAVAAAAANPAIPSKANLAPDNSASGAEEPEPGIPQLTQDSADGETEVTPDAAPTRKKLLPDAQRQLPRKQGNPPARTHPQPRSLSSQGVKELRKCRNLNSRPSLRPNKRGMPSPNPKRSPRPRPCCP